MRPLLALVPTLAAAALSAGEPLTATAWDVRKDAQELLDELGRPGPDPADLLLRVGTMIAAHGSDLIAVSPSEAMPIADALAARLRKAGLAERFVREAGPAAERRLDELLAGRPAGEALTALARSAPGTPAAARAWRRAADVAWDLGRLRLFLDASAQEGDAAAGPRAARIAAARPLLAARPPALPDGLDGLELMWRIESSRAAAPAAPAGRRRDPARAGPQLPAAGSCGGGAIAISDGTALTVIDHLVGGQLGVRTALGDRALPQHVARPEATADGVVAVGISGGRIVLTCVDASGTERWRRPCGAEDADAASAPLLLDGVVALAYRVAGADRLEQRVLAVAARDGAPLWDTAIGQLAAPRWGADNLAPPAIARHARGLAVCSNAGSFALVGTDGAVRRLWSYPTRPDLEMDGVRRGRRGLAAGDGATAVATPSDHAGLVLVLGPDDQAPRAYRGDGADGDVLAVADGEALIAGRQVALVDTARLRLRWTAPLRLAEAQGIVGGGAILVTGSDQIALLDRRDGRMLSGRALGESGAMAAADGVLVLADAEGVRGFGDAKAFLARLREAAARAESDPRPHAALGAVLAGRGDGDGALAAWRRALELGAGPGIAERMARILRARVDAGGTAALDQLAALAPHLPGMADELHLWRARLAEAAGERAAAAGHYRAALQAEDRLLPMADGLGVGIRLLAAAGLARCDGRQADWPLRAVRPPPAPAPARAWSVDARTGGEAVLSEGAVVAFAGGLLQSWSVADGRPRWQRRPQRPLLGVRPWREAAADGVAISVLPGSAGEAAGLRDGDVLLSLNGTPLRDFDRDLRAMVMEMGGGAAFAFEVRSADGARRAVQGRLGGEPLAPLAAGGGIILARTTMPLNPARTDLRIIAVDAETGEDLWTQALTQVEARLPSSMPLLAGGIAVAADGADLVGIARDGGVRWRLPGRADLLAQGRALGGCVWAPAAGGDAAILDAATGVEIARIPATAGEDPVADGVRLAVRGADGRIAAWDLGGGRLLSRSADPGRPLAIRGDALLALDLRGRPAVIDLQTGAVRRALADMPVEAHCVAGATVHVSMAGAERRALAAIAIDGMVLRWSVDLPPGLEVESLQPAGDGALAVLREGTRTWALLLDGRGDPTASRGWASDPGGGALACAGGGIVLDRSGTMSALLPAAPPVQPALRCAALDRARPLRDAWASALPGLAWTPAGDGGALAIARHDLHLVVAVRGGEQALRLCDTGGPIANDATRALAGPRGTRLAIPGSWSLAEQWVVDSPDGPIAVSAWAPLPSRAPGAPVSVLLGERDGLPWWLAAAWNRVADPP